MKKERKEKGKKCLKDWLCKYLGKYFEITTIIVIFLIIAILSVWSNKAFPAELITQGQLAPYTGIIITPESGKKIITLQAGFEELQEENQILQEMIIELQEKATTTTLMLTNLEKEKEAISKVLQEEKNKHRWDWLKSIAYGVAGFSMGYLIGNIIK